MELRRKISTGIKSLDLKLFGGFSIDEVAFIYGEPSTGKTTLLLSAAARLISLDPVAKIVYVDSDGKFSTKRLSQMTNNDENLQRVIYTRPSSFKEQAEVLDNLPDKIQQGDLVCIDSFTGLYRLETGDSQKTFLENKELNRQLGQIKEIAFSKRVAVLLTGQVRNILESPVPAIEPVAQRLLRFWSDTVIRLENTSSQGVKQASVEKPNNLKGAVWFRITEKGLEDE
jgi:DNA repair protein RadB